MTWLPILALIAVISIAVFEPCESHRQDEVKVIVKVPLNGRNRYGYDYGRFVCPYSYGRYPHPRDCASYYVCKRGWPIRMRCPDGELYDVEKGRCLDEDQAVCVSDDSGEGGYGNRDKDKDRGGRVKNLKEITFDRLVVDEDYRCPYEWGTFAHPIDCSKYYVCVRKVATVHQCPGTELFDDKTKRCLHKNLVVCGKRLDRDEMKKKDDCGTTTVSPKVPVIGTFRFVCPCADGRFPDPEDCSRFYLCRSNIPTLHQCPASTLYDIRTEQCLPENLVVCGGRPGGGRQPDPREIICPYAWGTFPHPFDCSKYIICIYDIPSVYTCKDSELYDVRYRRCLPQEQVDCGGRTPYDFIRPTTKPTTVETTTTPRPTTTTTTPMPTTTTTTPMPTTTTTTPVPTTTTTTPAPTTTTTTLRPTTKATPRTTVSDKKKPNTPPPHDCKEDDLDCIIDVTGDPVGWFDCPAQYGHFPHGASRQLFIHCDNWHPFVKKCADHTVFSPNHLVCVWATSENK